MPLQIWLLSALGETYLEAIDMDVFCIILKRLFNISLDTLCLTPLGCLLLCSTTEKDEKLASLPASHSIRLIHSDVYLEPGHVYARGARLSAWSSQSCLCV